MDPIINQLATSSVIVAFVEWLKETKWIPFINHNSSTINRLVSVFFAIFSGMGLGYMYDPTAGIFTITGLQPSHMANTAWATFTSFGTQWLVYKLAIRKGEPGQLPLAVSKAPANEVTPANPKVQENEI